MSEALQKLLNILELEKIDTNIYRGTTPETTNSRVFGGQVFAQAMRASQDTVDDERLVPVVVHVLQVGGASWLMQTFLGRLKWKRKVGV